MNNDGHPDIAVANNLSENVSVFLNSGAGTFPLSSTYSVGYKPYSVFAGDIDGDGDTDLIVTASAASVFTMRTFKNLGNGTFTAGDAFPTVTNPTCVRGADLDGDGDLDLAVSCVTDNRVQVFKNNGSGTFGLDSNYIATAPFSLVLCDLDGDGAIDMAVASVNENPGTVRVWKNKGNGRFTGPVTWLVGGVSVTMRRIACADVDEDGDMDLVTVEHCNPPNVSLLRNNGLGSFGLFDAYSAGSFPADLTTCDMDRDGHVDLVVANTNDNNLSVLRNAGGGTFSPPQNFPTGRSPACVRAADFDLDVKTDIAAALYDADSIAVLTNCGCNCPHQGDMNDDGVPDVFDVIYLIDYVFSGGAAPPKDPLCPHINRSDVNCDGVADVFDVIYLIDFVFSGGKAPCDPCTR